MRVWEGTNGDVCSAVQDFEQRATPCIKPFRTCPAASLPGLRALLEAPVTNRPIYPPQPLPPARLRTPLSGVRLLLLLHHRLGIVESSLETGRFQEHIGQGSIPTLELGVPGTA